MSMDKSLEAISKLYSKYEKQGSVYMPPETLDSVESDAERLKSPYLSLDRYLGGGPALGKITTYSGFFSTGKCLGKGTKIIMYDGTLKNVEDIKAGEKLMGPDSTPREVLSTTRGIDTLYKVKQKRGIDYVVNSEHILSLKKTKYARYSRYTDSDGRRLIDKTKLISEKKVEVVNLPIKEVLELMNQKSSFNNTYKGYKAKELYYTNDYKVEENLSPYMLGLWLADGTSSKPEITNIDDEIKEYIYDEAERIGCIVREYSGEGEIAPRYSIITKRGTDNPFLKALQKLDLINNKHIPKEYLFSSYQNRLELLSGIIDGDGHLSRGNNITITQKNKRLIDDIKVLAQGIGFSCTVKPKKGTIKSINFEGDYFRITLGGADIQLPLKLSRKIKTNTRTREYHNTTIDIEELGIGEYFGFEINGDHLFLLEDQTVTHNTSLALALAGHNKDKTIGFIDAEYNWSDSSYLWIDKYFGIEKERIHVMHPVYLEEAAEMIEDMCDALDVVIYDGFDMVAPKGEYQGSMEDNTMGLMARSYKKFFRRSMGKIYKTNTALIITNHLYENVGNVYEPYKEPGGRAISDYASQKLYLTTGKLKQGEEVVGQKVRFNIKKDKLNGNKDLKFEMEYNREFGFDVFVDIINNAEELGVMTKKGSWYYYDGSTIGQGKQKTADILVDNPELVEEIVGRCKELF